jgi:hypothetical protein
MDLMAKSSLARVMGLGHSRGYLFRPVGLINISLPRSLQDLLCPLLISIFKGLFSHSTLFLPFQATRNYPRRVEVCKSLMQLSVLKGT